MAFFSYRFCRFLVLICILIMCQVSLKAQKKSLRFQHYSMEEGLPQNLVDCILQDSRGFMWFGTWGGLCRFDGYTFKIYRQQTREYSTVSNNFIYALEEDNNGNLWIGTNSGLNIYQYNIDSFRHAADENPDFNILRNKVTAIAKADENSIWVGSSAGLSKITINSESSLKNIESTPYGKDKYSVLGTSINHLLFDSRSNLWVSTDSGICLLPSGTNIFKFIRNNPSDPNSIPFNTVKCVFEDSNGLIWIGTEFGLSNFIPSQNKFVNFFHDPENSGSLIHNYVMSVAEDVNGNILIGTYGGISVLKKNSLNRFLNYTKSPYSEYALNNDFVNCLYKDKNGNIWIGTEGGGINRYNSSKSEIEYFGNEMGNPNSLSSNFINSILEDKENLWIGTAGGGLNRYNKNSGVFRHYKYIPGNNVNNLNNFISAIHRDNQNNLWIGSWGTGIYKLIDENTSRERFINYRPLPSGKGLINDYVSSIISDSIGNIWIGTYEGLDKYNVSTGNFESFTAEAKNSHLSRIGCLLFDSANNLWVGTRQGLFKIVFNLHKPGYEIKSFFKDEKRSNSLSDNYVTAIYQDSNDTIWFGTYGFGLNKLITENEGGVFECLTTDDGLPNNIIYRILEDNSGNLWLTTEFGLSVYNSRKRKFKNYFIADGLQNNQYYWNAAFKNKEGRLYFGGMNGVNSFFPDSINIKVKYQPQVVITDFKIYNKSVRPGTRFDRKIILNQSILSSKQLAISYKSKEISFEFSALNYEQPGTINYAYMLYGFDEKWNIVGPDRRFAGYTNLKPGTYIFKVKATDNNGDWGDSSTNIKLRIIPPFWDTWWFRSILILFIISVVVFYNRYRVYSLRIQKRKLEKQVLERTSEIEKQKEKLTIQNEQIHKQRDKLFELNKKVKSVNELKLKFFTNISHEFRTPVTLIIGPVERLLNDPATPDLIKNTLSLVNRNANRLLHLINQLMDFRKIEQGKADLYVSLVNIDEFLTNIAQAFSALAEQKNINLKLNKELTNTETWFDFQKIEIVLYNLLSNAFKFTASGGTINIRAKLNSNNSEYLEIKVSDTGMGIPEENLDLIFNRFYQIESNNFIGDSYGTGIGLALTKELVELHKGVINVESQPGKGTTFSIEIPVKRECFTSLEITEKNYVPTTITNKVLTLTDELMRVERDNSFTYPTTKKSGRPTVLVVEDNNDLREFIASRLNENYNILKAQNGREGLELASENNPEIIVSDIMMPEMDGLELCIKIKSNILTSHIPVILLTAKSDIEDEIKGIGMGADNYLPKPFNFSLLEAYIANLIESRKKLFETFLSQQNTDTKILAKTSTDELFLNNVVKIIQENVENSEFNVTALADKMIMSRGHLHRKLISLSNLSPVDFINNIRLKKSIELLHNLNLNISEVAYAVGYNDPKYFARLFRKQFGKTPSKFQEEIQRKTGTKSSIL